MFKCIHVDVKSRSSLFSLLHHVHEHYPETGRIPHIPTQISTTTYTQKAHTHVSYASHKIQMLQTDIQMHVYYIYMGIHIFMYTHAKKHMHTCKPRILIALYTLKFYINSTYSHSFFKM